MQVEPRIESYRRMREHPTVSVIGRILDAWIRIAQRGLDGIVRLDALRTAPDAPRS
jgi:hypothetical protein